MSEVPFTYLLCSSRFYWAYRDIIHGAPRTGFRSGRIYSADDMYTEWINYWVGCHRDMQANEYFNEGWLS